MFVSNNKATNNVISTVIAWYGPPGWGFIINLHFQCIKNPIVCNGKYLDTILRGFTRDILVKRTSSAKMFEDFIYSELLPKCGIFFAVITDQLEKFLDKR
ncbi:hypothetical protein Trydic_g19216 [Trypoxylus dichotomus]